jgi:hypothetical protein
MTSSPEHESLTLSPESFDQMERLGITRVPVNYFYVAGFRYTQLKDAIAQAEHQRVLK